MVTSSDVVIVGGGVIGLSLAWELARADVRVVLLDAGAEKDRHASWAGAGMLPPAQCTATDPWHLHLRSLSSQLWPDWSERLAEASGIAIGYRRCGGVELFVSAEQRDHFLAQARTAGVAAEGIDPDDIPHFSPAMSADRWGVWLPQFAQVRNPWLLRSLREACRRAGVVVHYGANVSQLLPGPTGVRLDVGSDSIDAPRAVIAAGPWSRKLFANYELPVFPVRGQIVALEVSTPIGAHIIEEDDRYIVPRGDGVLLVGSTEEHVGFDTQTTDVARDQLLQFACERVPALHSAKVIAQWAGLRPGSPVPFPWLGSLDDDQRLFVATGHYRHGLLLSPATARLMQQLLLGQPLDVPLPSLNEQRQSIG